MQAHISRTLIENDQGFYKIYSKVLYSTYNLILLQYRNYLDLILEITNKKLLLKPGYSLYSDDTQEYFYQSLNVSNNESNQDLILFNSILPLLLALKPVTGIFLMLNNSEMFLIGNSAQNNDCVKIDCRNTVWYQNTLEFSEYLSETIYISNKSQQFLCKSSSSIVVCVTFNISYLENMFMTSNLRLIWHKSPKFDLTHSEFPSISYPFKSSELSLFTTSVLPNISKPSLYLAYTLQGSQQSLYSYSSSISNLIFSFRFSTCSSPPSKHLSKTVSLILVAITLASFLFQLLMIILTSKFHEILSKKLKKRIKSASESVHALVNGDLERRIVWTQCESEIENLMKAVEHNRILIKFRKCEKGEYCHELFSYSEQFTHFKTVGNPEAAAECLLMIAESQFFYGKHQEALENIEKSLKIIKRGRAAKSRHMMLIVKICIVSKFCEGNYLWEEILKVFEKVIEKNEEYWCYATILYAKNGMLEEAEKAFARIDQEVVGELKLFVTGIIKRVHGQLKKAAKTYFKVMSLNKYFDPNIRCLCISELKSIFPSTIDIIMTETKASKDIVFLIETSQEMPEKYLKVINKCFPVFVNTLQDSDRVGFCTFNSSIITVCELLEISVHKNSIKQCFKAKSSENLHPKLLEALSKALQLLCRENNPPHCECLFEASAPTQPHKLLIVVCSGLDFSRPGSFYKLSKQKPSSKSSLLLLTTSALLHDFKPLTNQFKSLKHLSISSPKHLSTVFYKLSSLI